MERAAGSDEQLIAAAIRGEDDAFDGLVARWYGRVLAHCQARLICRSDAEDAAQECFLRAHQSLPQLQDGSRLGAWLRGISTHVCIDVIRRRQRRPAVQVEDLDSLPAGGEAGPLEAASARDDRQCLNESLNQLPEALREVLLLHYFNEMTYSEMAEWLGVARATVNERLCRGRAALRRRLLLGQER